LSWDDFLEAFKKRHPKDYGIDSGGSVAVKAPMSQVEAKAPEIKPQVAKEVVIDRMSQAAGEDWDSIEYTEEPEVIE
jgi:hypothetical protein